VLSHLLSYPLTLAHYLSHICPAPSQGTAHLVVLGARAEATLPSLWWRELLCYHASSPSLRLGLHMVGPDLPGGNGGGERVPLSLGGQEEEEEEEQQQQREEEQQLTLYRHRGLYHELVTSASGK
jgi:hypothetical protein